MISNRLKLNKEILSLIKLYKIIQTKKAFVGYFFPEYFKRYNIRTNSLTKKDLLYEIDCNPFNGSHYKLINKFIKENILELKKGIDVLNRPINIYSINQENLKKKINENQLFRAIYEIIENETTLMYGHGFNIKGDERL